jgi:hypothetical protein
MMGWLGSLPKDEANAVLDTIVSALKWGLQNHAREASRWSPPFARRAMACAERASAHAVPSDVTREEMIATHKKPRVSAQQEHNMLWRKLLCERVALLLPDNAASRSIYR